MVFNKHLHKLITAKGHTPYSFAASTGVDRGYLSRILHGKQRPGVDIALKIAFALDSTPASIWPVSAEPKRRK